MKKKMRFVPNEQIRDVSSVDRALAVTAVTANLAIFIFAVVRIWDYEIPHAAGELLL
jgi:hypothetical protein